MVAEAFPSQSHTDHRTGPCRTPNCTIISICRQTNYSSTTIPTWALFDFSRRYRYPTPLIIAGDTAPDRIPLSGTAAAVAGITHRLTGGSKVIKDHPITLEVFRHHQVDLTLVDLPGITRNAPDGGDGEALEKQIKDLVQHYIRPKESVILNVLSAMEDPSNSAGVQQSQKVDPSGERSLLCVTKVDQHKESGLGRKIRKACADMRVSDGNVFAVCNRWEGGERAAEDPFLQPLRNEGMAKSSLGLEALTSKLTIIQSERIRATLPETLALLTNKREELEEEAVSLGDAVELRGDGPCRAVALGLIDTVSERLKASLEGRASHDLEDGGDGAPLNAVNAAFEDLLHLGSVEEIFKREDGEGKMYSQGTTLHGLRMRVQIEKGKAQQMRQSGDFSHVGGLRKECASVSDRNAYRCRNRGP